MPRSDDTNSLYRITFQSRNPHLLQGIIGGILGTFFFLHGAMQDRWVFKMDGFSPALTLFVTHAFCWLFVIMSSLTAYGSVEEWIRQRAKGLVLEVATDGLVLPCGFAGSKRYRIAYSEITRIEKEDVSTGLKATVLHVITRNRRIAISSIWFPNQDDFAWFEAHLYAHASHPLDVDGSNYCSQGCL